jgi:hypothetical protein
MDLKTFGRNFLRRPPGYRPSKEEFEADKKAYEYYVKQQIDNTFKPELLNTQQGMYARYDGTNAVPIATMTTNSAGQMQRDHLMGYAAQDSYGGGPAPMAGGGAFAGTNAPTPSPTPYPEGAKIRSKRDGMIYQVVNGVPQLIPGQ